MCYSYNPDYSLFYKENKRLWCSSHGLFESVLWQVLSWQISPATVALHSHTKPYPHPHTQSIIFMLSLTFTLLPSSTLTPIFWIVQGASVARRNYLWSNCHGSICQWSNSRATFGICADPLEPLKTKWTDGESSLEFLSKKKAEILKPEILIDRD